MKKLTIDPRFWLTAAFCAALLAAPPLLTQARDRPWLIIAEAIFSKPAMLAPATRLPFMP